MASQKWTSSINPKMCAKLMKQFNTLDHVIVSGDLFATAVNSLTVIPDVDNTSDHDPIVLQLDLRFGLLARADKQFISKPA